MTLKSKIKAFAALPLGKVIYYNDGDYINGIASGKGAENARLQPLIEALAEFSEASKVLFDNIPDLTTGIEYAKKRSDVIAALAALEKLIGEK